MSILEVNNVSKFFGGVKANEDISLTVEQGSIVADGPKEQVLEALKQGKINVRQ